MKYLIAIWALTTATLVYANCTSHTYFINGKMVVCQTCCYGGNCNTTCF
jgi:hypothetical protein